MKIKKFKFNIFKIIAIFILLSIPLVLVEYLIRHIVFLDLYYIVNDMLFTTFLTTACIGIVGFLVLLLCSTLIFKKYNLKNEVLMFKYNYIPLVKLFKILKKKTKENIKIPIGISIANFIVSGLTYILICKVLEINVSFPFLILVVYLSLLIGFLCAIPFGFLGFDISIFILLSCLGADKSLILIAIGIYRAFYTLLPNIILGIAWLIKKWKVLNGKFNKVPEILTAKVALFILRFFVFISGVLLLLLTAFPEIILKIPEVYFISSATAFHFSKMLIGVVGFLLIVMSKLLKYKTNSMYLLTIIFLIIGAILTFTRAHNYIAIGYLIVISIIVLLSKKAFNKKGFIVSVEDIISTVIVLLIFWVTYLILGSVAIDKNHLAIHHKFATIIHNYKNLINIGTVGFILSLIFLYLIYLFGKYTNRLPVEIVDNYSLEIEEFLKTHNGTSLTHLIYLKDKYVFFSKDRRGMIQYSIISNKLIVLGNPLGDSEEDIYTLINEFYDFADNYGYMPVFFEVSNEMMGILHNYGFEFMKLGEAAIVKLDEFTIAGQKMQKVRTCVNKINRENFTFKVVKPLEITEELLDELEVVSKVWLGDRSEMGFSMGFFDREYLKKSPIGLVRDGEGVLTSFVSIMPTYGENKTFCSDLMRHLKKTPRGLMDYTFVNLLLWGKDEGYEYFNFGVSPLSNVGFSKYSFLSERIASQVYYHGNIFYSFSGLKSFKAKYANIWEQKSLAYRNKLSLPITALQANLVVSTSKPKV